MLGEHREKFKNSELKANDYTIHHNVQMNMEELKKYNIVISVIYTRQF